MAEYIDRDTLLDKLPDDLPYKASVKRVLMQADTADVVPKSEVEQLKAMYEDNETQRAYTINMLGEHLETAKNEVEMLQGALKAEERHNELTMEMAQKAIQNAKTEVAREIFADMKKCLWQRFSDEVEGEYRITEEDFAELKKKYIQQECPQCTHFVGCECFDGKTCDEYEEKKE